MSFDQAFASLQASEGGYSNNPADPGQETMYGITAVVARRWGYAGAMRELPQSTARQIAKSEYWDRYQCDQFGDAVGFAVFDAAYNGGAPAQWLQQAAGATVDGNIGAKTIAAVRAADPMRIVMRFTALRILYLAELNTWPTFGRGWANRMANNLMTGAK